MQTTVYRKPTNNDIYLNWNLLSPKSWKRRALRIVTKKAYVIYSTVHLLQKELGHISFAFQKYNNFPKWIIDQGLYQVKKNHHFIRRVQTEINDVRNEKSHLLVFPSTGQKRERLIKSMKTTLKYSLPNNIFKNSAYSASKLSNKFNIKLKIRQDQHDVTYYFKYPAETCREDCIGEAGRRLSGRVIDHNGRDKSSHVLKHCIEKEHKVPSVKGFMILGTNYKKKKFRRKISRSLYIKENLSSLNTQEKSVAIKLFS